MQRLNELGWVVGRNVSFETRYAEGDLARITDFAVELVRLKVNVILAFGTAASFAAKRATATIPIVMFAGDPVGTGLVVSLAHPGGNLTGLTQEAGLEILAKRLELLKEVAPKISRVGAVYNATNSAEVRGYEVTVESARSLRLTLVPLGVRAGADFEGAFRAGTPRTGRCARDRRECPQRRAEGPPCQLRRGEPTTDGVRRAGFCRCRRADVVWSKLH